MNKLALFILAILVTFTSFAQKIDTVPNGISNDKVINQENIQQPKTNGDAVLAIYKVLKDDFDKKNWGDLENQADDYRKNLSRTPSGNFKLRAYYDFICGYGAVNEKDLRANEVLFEEWGKAYPNSPTPIIAWSEVLSCYGWHARGTGYMNSIEPNQLKLFLGGLSQSYSILMETKTLTSQDPEWYVLILDELKGVYAGPDRDQKVFDLSQEAYAKFPSFFSIYTRGISSQEPKWGGSIQGIKDYIALFKLDIDKNDDDLILYTKLYGEIGSCFCKESTQILQASGAQWEEVKRGWETIEAKYPDPINYVYEVKYAALAGDTETIVALADKVNANPVGTIKAVFNDDGSDWKIYLDWAQKIEEKKGKHTPAPSQTKEQIAALKAQADIFKQKQLDKQNEGLVDQFEDWIKSFFNIKYEKNN